MRNEETDPEKKKKFLLSIDASREAQEFIDILRSHMHKIQEKFTDMLMNSSDEDNDQEERTRPATYTQSEEIGGTPALNHRARAGQPMRATSGAGIRRIRLRLDEGKKANTVSSMRFDIIQIGFTWIYIYIFR